MSSVQPCPAACPRSHSASSTDDALSQLLIPLPQGVPMNACADRRRRHPSGQRQGGEGKPTG
ncbi:hypothetical protein ABZ504_43405 [Streptomyces mirabilis]|uniref:hypothetical protein n=1 Tax=Streptomyces mirabilis TaxID=68239 RepID=UPI0033C74107